MVKQQVGQKRNFLDEQEVFDKQFLLQSSGSRRDGISYEVESRTRRAYTALIRDGGMDLQCSQWAIHSAIVLCHRFFAYRSMKQNDVFYMAMGCMFFAGKWEESPKRVNDVVRVFWAKRYHQKPLIAERIKDRSYLDFVREQVLDAERSLMFTLEFKFQVDMPYDYLLQILKEVYQQQNNNKNETNSKQSKRSKRDQDPPKIVIETAWNLIVDCLRTTLFIQYEARIVACACVCVAMLLCENKLPQIQGQALWEYCRYEEQQVADIMDQLLQLYEEITLAWNQGQEQEDQTQQMQISPASDYSAFTREQGKVVN